eukprot:2442783-Ditylum_brightwellii.AAC.1
MRTEIDEKGANVEVGNSDQSGKEDTQEKKGKGEGKISKQKKDIKGNMPNPKKITRNYKELGRLFEWWYYFNFP